MRKTATPKMRPQIQRKTKEAIASPLSSHQSRPPAWHRRLWVAAELLLGAATLFGLLSFAPRFALEPPSAPVADALNPFDEPFTLTNVGYLSVYDVTASCDDPRVGGMPAFGKPSFEKGKPFNISAEMIIAGFTARKLEPQDPHAVPCNSVRSITSQGQAVAVTFASITIAIHFKILRFIPWSTKQFRFEATLHSDHKLHWSHQALDGLGDSKPASTYAWTIGTYNAQSAK